ncbi:hypothetical protein IFM89_017129 [Coptis chinensis]|uniref:Uncharacterized protein n=1 Tax=Coptis chinensis TaxID=261450 RepID=A0A835LVP0_9MAGN|nr:hypothetical protein IFM89_017129 [Coptis chinensis]
MRLGRKSSSEMLWRGGKTDLRSYLKRKLKLSPVEEDIGEKEENKEEHEHSSEDESQQAPVKRMRRSSTLTKPTIDLNFVADVFQLDTMEVELDNVQIKMPDSQSKVEQLKDCNKLSVREKRAAEVCLDKLLEVKSLYGQTLKTGHAADLTVRVYGRGMSINLSTYQLLRQYQWLNHEVILVYMTLLDNCYNRLERYEDFVTIRELSKYYAIILDTQMLVYMESLYAIVGETLTDRSLTTEEKISILASNMSWSLRLTFKELLEENTRIPYVTKSKGLMMAFDLSDHLWILVIFCFHTWTCLIYDSLADVIADPTPRMEKICTLLSYTLLMHNKDCVPQSQLQRKWIIKYQDWIKRKNAALHPIGDSDPLGI